MAKDTVAQETPRPHPTLGPPSQVSDWDREECMRLAIRMIATIRQDRSQRDFLAQTLDRMEATVAEKRRRR